VYKYTEFFRGFRVREKSPIFPDESGREERAMLNENIPVFPAFLVTKPRIRNEIVKN